MKASYFREQEASLACEF